MGRVWVDSTGCRTNPETRLKCLPGYPHTCPPPARLPAELPDPARPLPTPCPHAQRSCPAC
ncbi:hypothetical protein MA16_Dca023323 [Dendrobium catenatum]|uniref:Uncharacterized protein n=1 Tax=Dendrobium catenatum TaxID=906689 RepID=A0A2I0VH72_9ASPA|nr:hypothetical protein MA16_Dca023323 [Dendrobium catenatum]